MLYIGDDRFTRISRNFKENPPPAEVFAVPAFGGFPSQPLLYTLSTADASVIDTETSDLPLASGFNGLATHPTTGTLYAIFKPTSITTVRTLATVALDGTVTTIGSTLSAPISSIAFKNDGTLLGVSSRTANDPHQLYSIDLTTGALTLLGSVQATSIGVALAGGPDGFLYHFYATSQNSAPYPVVLSKINLDTLVETPVGSVTGTTGFNPPSAAGFVGGVLYYGTGSGELYTVDTTTAATVHLGTMPTQMKGLATPTTSTVATVGPIEKTQKKVTVTLRVRIPGTGGSYQLQESDDGVTFTDLGAPVTQTTGSQIFASTKPFIQLVATLPQAPCIETVVLEDFGTPVAVGGGAGGGGATGPAGVPGQDGEDGDAGPQGRAGSDASLTDVMSDFGVLEYCNEATTTGPDGEQGNYLDDAPLAAVNAMGYLSDPAKTSKDVYFFVDDFTAHEIGAQSNDGTIEKASHYFVRGKGVEQGVAYAPYFYISGASILQAGQAVIGAPLDAGYMYNDNASFIYWPGRRLWFSARVANVYSKIDGSGVCGGVGLLDHYRDGPAINVKVSDWHNLTALIDPPTQDPYAANPDNSGSMDAGTHSYKYTFVTANGETTPSGKSNTITADGSNNRWGVNIPFGPSGTTARKVYRTAAGNGDSGPWKFLATVNNNFGMFPPDGAADSSLGSDEPPSENTATAVSVQGGLYFQKDADEADWSFIASGLDGFGNIIYVRKTGLVNIALGHDLQDTIYVDLAFKVVSNGDVHLYVNGKGAGIILNTHAALVALAANDFNNSGPDGLNAMRTFAMGVSTDDGNPRAFAIDHVMIAEEAVFLEED